MTSTLPREGDTEGMKPRRIPQAPVERMGHLGAQQSEGITKLQCLYKHKHLQSRLLYTLILSPFPSTLQRSGCL